ncbi:MAG: diphosphate--fructose-6-phosphate 1-phosphotransferase [Spirochaetes bacterium]|jgi:pyrophosphate--fructose-6-phosphate 1-phosphotransferase|nr:diphosphate--fructose-6-phosphate 1-phosphotransferase [Spirochaetota bacterium]
MSKITDLLIGMEKHKSIFENEIRSLPIPTCSDFGSPEKPEPIEFTATDEKLESKDSAAVKEAFANSFEQEVLKAAGTNKAPLSGKQVAVLFSGGPAAGGHNVVYGLKKILGNSNTLFGVKAGPKGLIQGNLFEITDQNIAPIINTGGFDFLGSDRTKIKTDEQFQSVKNTCVNNKLDAIVVIGGDDSNTNAAILAEYLSKDVKSDGSGVQVIGVPKTIDGDLQIGDILPISFGFDTATKIYAEMVGNILQDTPSSRKYWHFIKVMGRSASHVALEVALQTKPAVTLISEEVAENSISLAQIVDHIANAVVNRSKKGINYGVVLIPEGVIEFIPEMNSLIAELNDKVAEFNSELSVKNNEEKRNFIYTKLTPVHAQLMSSLPDYLEDMLLADRDSHGNLQVSLIPTERMLIDMVTIRIKELDASVPFATLNHFFGYEGRCGAPTLFDAAYCYNLGLTAGSLILAGKTGYMASVADLNGGGQPLGIPLPGLLNIERRQGKDEFVIEKALADTKSPAMKFFTSRRDVWAQEDCFASPGPRQLWGPASRQIPMTVALNRNYNSLDFNIGK